MHLLAATHVLLAAEQAADETKEYVSQRAYGVWQVEAVYQHLEAGTAPLYDTHAPISAFGGKSALELSQEAFDRYTTYQIYRMSVTDTPYFVQTFPADETATEAESAKRLYALLSSLSGPEALPQAAVTPPPSATPEPEPTSAPALPTAQTEPAAMTPERETPYLIYSIGAGLTALGIVSAMLCLFRIGQAPGGRRKTLRIAGAIAGVLLALLGAVLISARGCHGGRNARRNAFANPAADGKCCRSTGDGGNSGTDADSRPACVAFQTGGRPGGSGRVRL